MSGSSGLADAAVAAALPHPATRTIITTAMSGAAEKLRVFIFSSGTFRPGSWPYADTRLAVPADNRPGW